MEVTPMVMMFDPFRDLGRFTEQVLGTAARPSGLPVDAWRDGDGFVVEFDVPGIAPDALDVQVDHDVLTVTAERPEVSDQNGQWVIAERPHGVFRRQLSLGQHLDTEHIEADYHSGVLRVRIPVAETAKPRKIAIGSPAPQHALDQG
ncbi:Hsp20/alpha crystallin family protein [Mycolicibacterium pallens]|nr:HSP20 family small heat-shock protein [Mycolicibacterium pallens]